jgi:hypothetical protein
MTARILSRRNKSVGSQQPTQPGQRRWPARAPRPTATTRTATARSDSVQHLSAVHQRVFRLQQVRTVQSIGPYGRRTSNLRPRASRSRARASSSVVAMRRAREAPGGSPADAVSHPRGVILGSKPGGDIERAVTCAGGDPDRVAVAQVADDVVR